MDRAVDHRLAPPGAYAVLVPLSGGDPSLGGRRRRHQRQEGA
jgi:hypothetical protein